MCATRTICAVLVLSGVAVLTASAEPPTVLKKVSTKSGVNRNVYVDEPAKVAPPILAVRDARTGKISTQQRMLNMTRAGLRTNVFDQFSLPGSARGANVSYLWARAYFEPNFPRRGAWSKGMSPFDDGSPGARPGPNNPFCEGRDTIVFDEYFVDLNDWPSDANDAAEVTFFEFYTRATNEAASILESQINQLNVTFFDPNGSRVNGAFEVFYEFGKTTFGGPQGRAAFPSSFNAYCSEFGFSTRVTSSGWVCFDWIDHDLDANLVPKFDPNDPFTNMYVGAGMMYAGGIPNEPNGCFGLPRDPNYPFPAETIQNGFTGSTLLKDPNDPNSVPLNQVWLHKTSLWRANTPTMRCGADPNSDGQPGVSYYDILQNEEPNAPAFTNWFGLEPINEHILCSDFPMAIYVKPVCPGEDPNHGPTCRTDLDGDCLVGPPDLTLLLSKWMQRDPAFDLDCDPNTPVGPQDLTLLLAEWFNDCR